MDTPPEAFRPTVLYVRVCGAGTVFIVAFNVLSAIFRGLGDAKSPLVYVAIACVANVVGDVAFVAGFGMGPLGAAIATVLAQALSVGCALAHIARRGLSIPFSVCDFRLRPRVVRQTLRLGSPLALQDACMAQGWRRSFSCAFRSRGGRAHGWSRTSSRSGFQASSRPPSSSSRTSSFTRS